MKQKSNLGIRRGDIVIVDLSPVVGSEQGGLRPFLILQNDIGNRFSPCTIGACITGQMEKAKLPTHVELSAEEYNLNKDSVLLLEQIRTIDKSRIQEVVSHVDEELMTQVDYQIAISLGFHQSFLSLMIEVLPKLLKKRVAKIFGKSNKNNSNSMRHHTT